MNTTSKTIFSLVLEKTKDAVVIEMNAGWVDMEFVFNEYRDTGVAVLGGLRSPNAA